MNKPNSLEALRNLNISEQVAEEDTPTTHNTTNDQMTDHLNDQMITTTKGRVKDKMKVSRLTPLPVASNVVSNNEILAQVLNAGLEEPNVRLNVEVRQSLHNRLKQYCVMHNVTSMRALVEVLLDNFLKSQGY